MIDEFELIFSPKIYLDSFNLSVQARKSIATYYRHISFCWQLLK